MLVFRGTDDEELWWKEGEKSSHVSLQQCWAFCSLIDKRQWDERQTERRRRRKIIISARSLSFLSTGCFIQESVRQDWTKAQSWRDKWLPCSMSSFYFLFFLTVCFWWHSVFTYHGLWRCKKKNRVFGYVKSRTPGTNRFIHRGQSQRTYQGTVCTRVHLQLLHICLHTLDGF